MSLSSIANLFSFFTPSKPPPPPPKVPFLQLSASPTDSHPSSSRPKQEPLFPLVSNTEDNKKSSSNSDITSVVCPSLAYANTLFFKSPYNAEIIVDEDEPEEQIIGRFRREVMRAGVIQEVRRRKHFETKHEKAKRKAREAALRNRRRRGPPRDFSEDFKESSENTRDPDDDDDNWDYTARRFPN